MVFAEEGRRGTQVVEVDEACCGACGEGQTGRVECQRRDLWSLGEVGVCGVGCGWRREETDAATGAWVEELNGVERSAEGVEVVAGFCYRCRVYAAGRNTALEASSLDVVVADVNFITRQEAAYFEVKSKNLTGAGGGVEAYSGNKSFSRASRVLQVPPIPGYACAVMHATRRVELERAVRLQVQTLAVIR